MLLCTHLAGMRVGEAPALRICDVLAAAGAILEEVGLSAAQTKGNSAITVLLPKRLRDELATYLQQRFGLADLLAVTYSDTTRALFPA